MTGNATRTLREINTALASLSMPELSPGQATELQKIHPKAKFLAVLDGAILGKEDSRARLATMLGDVTATQPRGTASAPSAAAQEQPAGSEANDPEKPDEAAQGADRNHKQIRIYSMKNGVIIFEASTDKSGNPTLMIEAAPRLESARQGKPRAGEKCYDYDRKILFAVMENELPQLMAFLYGYSSQINFKFHGEDKSKAVHLEWQGDNGARKVFARVRNSETIISLPIEASAVYHVGLLCASVMTARYPGITDSSLLYLSRLHGPAFEAIATKNADNNGDQRKAG